MIRFDDLTFTHTGADTASLDHVNLEIPTGGFTLVTGAAGSGKSTLLRCMNGLVPHFHGGSISGSVTVDGFETLRLRPRQLATRVGFLGQDPDTHAVAETVEEDIRFTCDNLGFSEQLSKRRIEDALDAVGIAQLRTRKIRTLSGGERQRAALASVLAAMPSCMVLDEPTSQLDPQSAEDVLGAILRLRDEIGMTVVASEHRLDRVIQYADAVCMMEAGRADLLPTRSAIHQLPLDAQVIRLGRMMGWDPIPLTLREARLAVSGLRVEPPRPAPKREIGPTMLSAQGLCVDLDGSRVLRTIDISVGGGEIVALMGRNGTGKTTLLRAMAGMVPLSSGTVKVGAAPVLVPQNPGNVLFRDRLRDELVTTLRARGVPHDAERVSTEAEQYGIAHLLDRYPRDLSGGERTMSAIAAVTMGGPRSILMDEPTRGMDAPSKERLRRLCEEWSSEGRAIVIATHDVELAATLATRVTILSEGQIVADGPPEDLLADSLNFSTQMNKVFQEPSILTVEHALAALGKR